MFERIMVFDSPSDAHADFKVSSAKAQCGLTPGQYSFSDVSSQLNGLCNESYAAKVADSVNGVPVSDYLGIVRCGRILIGFQFATAQESSYDNVNNLVSGMEIAVPKLQGLLY
jgi:hypothetical protein